MTVKNAVEHFAFKLDKVWKATAKDAEAINEIMKFVEAHYQKQLNDHQLFAKLYVMVYAQFLEKYKTTVFDDIPVKELNKYLAVPMDAIVRRFTDKLNESELYEFFQELNIDMDKHPALISEEESNASVIKMEEALKDKSKKEKFAGTVWQYDVVKDNLEMQINNTINLFR